jgi:hypothetical protein
MQHFGAQPGDRNSLGYKDGIDQPPVEGSGVDPLPGQGRPIKPGEFILGYPGEAGVPLPMPLPDVLGRNGTFIGFRKYQSRVGAFNRFLHANGSTEQERELLAAKLVGRWRSGAPLTLAPDRDDPALGADPRRNNNFDYAKDTQGRQVAARLPHPAHEPARHAAHPPHRHQHPSPDPARHDVRTSVRPERPRRDGRRRAARGHLPVHQRQGDGDDGIPSAGVDQRRRFHRRRWRARSDHRAAAEDATFTIPKEPVRRRLHGIETFNVLRGGEYFFMPSLSGLKWLGNLSG